MRNFRLFFAGQMISQIGNWLTLVAQALLVLKLTDNNGLAVGLLTACQFLPVLLLGAWAGLVADRSDKRRLLVIVQAIAMLQSFALAALAFSGNPPVWSIYAVAFVGGITTAFDNPTRRAFVVEMVPEEDVQNAVSLNSALMTSSRIFGPALAGLLIVTVGYGWCFTVDGISYIAVIVGLLLMRTNELRSSPVAIKAKGQVRAGLRYARSKTDLWVPLVMMAIIGTLTFNFNVVMPLFVKTTLGGSDTTFTILYSVVSIGSLCGALLTARRKTIEVHDVVVGAALFGVAMLVFSAVARPRGVRPVRHLRRVQQHHLHDGVHGDRPAALRTGDARSRAGPAGHRLPRQHADRRTVHRLDLRPVRRPRRVRRRRRRARSVRRAGATWWTGGTRVRRPPTEHQDAPVAITRETPLVH